LPCFCCFVYSLQTHKPKKEPFHWEVGNSKVKYTGEDDETTKLSSFGGGLNFAYFPSPNFSVDLGLGYDIFRTKDEFDFLGDTIKVENTTGGVVFDLGFSAFF